MNEPLIPPVSCEPAMAAAESKSIEIRAMLAGYAFRHQCREWSEQLTGAEHNETRAHLRIIEHVAEEFAHACGRIDREKSGKDS